MFDENVFLVLIMASYGRQIKFTEGIPCLN